MSSLDPQHRRASLDDVRAVSVMRKLPHVTALFWILKTIAVTLGETGGDLFGITLGLGYLPTAAAFLAFFVVVVTLQVNASRFRPALFWAVVLSTSMVGTEISDFMNRGFGHASDDSGGIGYTWGGVILTSILAAVFLIWRRTGQTYDVENIATRTGEILYWVAILVSNTLGTSSGDVLAHDTPLGFRGAFFVMAAIMALLLAAHYLTGVSGTLLFWIAFVLTRPLGAAGGDYLVKPVDENGLGWGTLWGSVALLSMLGALIAYQTVQVRRAPLAPLPLPVNRVTGEAQRPNGHLVMGSSAGTSSPPSIPGPTRRRVALVAGVLVAVTTIGAMAINAVSQGSDSSGTTLSADGTADPAPATAGPPAPRVIPPAVPGSAPADFVKAPAPADSSRIDLPHSPPRPTPVTRTNTLPPRTFSARSPSPPTPADDAQGKHHASKHQHGRSSPDDTRSPDSRDGVLGEMLSGMLG